MHKLFEFRSITPFLCAFCAFLWLKNPCNLRNPWLIKDLRPCEVLYNCRETFTDVMDSLQIHLFLTNKANFRKSQMNVNKVLTMNYEKKTLGQHGKNKPNTKPIQTQYKANQSQNKPNSNPNKPNTNPIKTNPASLQVSGRDPEKYCQKATTVYIPNTIDYRLAEGVSP